MKRSFALIGSMLALAACSDEVTTPAAAPTAPALSGKYIVVYKDDSFAGPRLSVSEAITDAAARERINPTFVYSSAVKGFAAELTEAQLAAVKADPRVDYVEPDAEVKLFVAGVQTTNLFNWGLDRIDDVDLPLDLSFGWNGDGTGVNAYVLDTGINLNHLDFVGRGNYIPNGRGGDFVNDGKGDAADCQGHGTHVSGTVAGTYSGVAKNATLWVGRVVNCQGGGNASMVIAGMDWIAANGLKPGVVNMSLGYGNVIAVRDAATRLVAAGYVVVAAAGNGDFTGRPINACGEAPGNAPNVITVGATDNTDREASFSNYGTCVDILAPGVNITSSDYTVTNGLVSMGGTSMASPHVAGVAAQYLSLNPTATPAAVTTAIKNASRTNTITLHRSSSRNGTPNKFLASF
jgi:subtilisin family serine protease